MKKQDKLTPSELNTLLAMYQSIVTIITFFAGFVFVTIPLVIFSAEISSLYGRLILYLLLASLLIFTVTIDLFHSAVLRVYQQALSKTFQIFLGYPEPRIANELMPIGLFLALVSISFMLLLKGQEWAIEALVWFLISVGRIVSGHFVIRRFLRRPSSKP